MYALPGELRVNHLDLVSVEDLLGARGLVLHPYDLPLDLGHNIPQRLVNVSGSWARTMTQSPTAISPALALASSLLLL